MSCVTLSAFSDEIDMDLNVQMDELDKHKIKFIEMRGVDDKNIGSISIEEARKIKSRLDERGFKVSSLGSPVGKIYLKDDFEKHKQMFINLLKVANIIETKYIRIFSFFMEGDVNPDSCSDEVCDKLIELTELAKSHGVVLLHENEKEIFGDTAERCLHLVKAVNSDNFKLIFDPANFVQCNEDTLEAYELLKEHIEYFHIKDAELENSMVVPAGKGDGNIPQILDRVIAEGYTNFLTLEPHLGNFSGLAELENTDTIEGMEVSDASKFSIAVDALKNILTEKEIAFV